jgi:putative CocE/NonD family hydrolase
VDFSVSNTTRTFTEMKKRSGDGSQRSSASGTELLTPDEIYEITVDLSVTSNVFLPGHRIRLEVSSSNFPRFDRHTNTGRSIADDHNEDLQIAVNRVFHGPQRPSRLVLPVISREETVG